MVPLGVLGAKQDAAQRQVWIKWNDDVERRLGGAAPIDKRMVSVKCLCAQEGKAGYELLQSASEHGHEILRLRRGTRFRFYIVPIDPDPEHRLSRQEGVVL